jgi:hypothetical protein
MENRGIYYDFIHGGTSKSPNKNIHHQREHQREAYSRSSLNTDHPRDVGLSVEATVEAAEQEHLQYIQIL